MLKIGIVGCTGKLGSMIMNTALKCSDVELKYAIGRPGNQYIGCDISSILGGPARNIIMIDSILEAIECDVFIDCTNADTFLNNNLNQYQAMKKPLIIATTGFKEENDSRIEQLANNIPVFKTGNFSIALHDFIETLKFAAKRISEDTDVQIIEYHHNQKKDAPSGTAIMIQEALIQANKRLTKDNLNIYSVRAGNIYGEHHVIFANCKDEITEYIHKVSSRETFSNGAVEVARWIVKQQNGLYSMDDLSLVKG